MTEPRPPSKSLYEAAYILPEGWVVLLPWVRTPEGHWWRPHLEVRHPDKLRAKEIAEHYARELTEASR